MQRPNRLKSLRADEELLLDEQADKLFKICDTDKKGFIVRADIARLDGLISNVSYEHLIEFFNANDKTRTGMVSKQDFTQSIKQLLLHSNQIVTQADFRKRMLRDLPPENFQTITLDEKPCTQTSEMRSKLSIRFGASPDQSLTNMWRGLAKVPSTEVTPSPSAGNLYAPIHVYIQESPRGSPKATTAPLSDNPETRNHSEFTQVLQRSAHSYSNLFLGNDSESKSKTAIFQPSLADELKNTNTARLYKVVLVGDSAVGKSCFLHRFCNNRFTPLFNATIGVDFTIRTIQVHNRLVSVQLWDTAGQERFRSITKQYFRKADAVILLFDITSEQSFLNTRSWIESIRNGVDDCCVLCLVANKIDLCPIEKTRTITYAMGKELAEEYDMIYFETSAYSGMGINDCMRALAVRLLQQDEENADGTLKLDLNGRGSKSWCCV
ncbi:Ras domain containing protein [Aphelenchoides bicaudatus]|nr:Ras domain containing protein [Aphelenchoides bicaudatus]